MIVNKKNEFNGDSRLKRHIFSALTVLLWIMFLTGCAYYNYFYNAKKYYNEAERSRREGSEDTRTGGRTKLSSYDKSIESAGRMLEYYPESRWEDDALLLLAKAYYRIGNYRKSIGKVDELIAKYPQSKFVHEGSLWKGMSLLMVAQPDSGRLILSDLFTQETESEIRAQAHQALGDYFFEQERWDMASEQFREVISSGSEDEWLRNLAWIRIGECLSRNQRISEAVELYDEILNSKPSRKIKLEATLRRAVILRQLGRTEEAYRSLEELLRDAAYINDFPVIELEAALCMREMEQYDESKERLEKLVEANKRGEVAAQAYFELGWLLWEKWRDLAGAYSALMEIKNAERSSQWISLGDSLKREIEALYGSWHWISFLENQLEAVDSSSGNLRELLPADTVYVDSLELVIQKDVKKSGERRQPKRSRRDRFKKLEEKPSAEADSSVDSTKVEIDSTIVALDSTTLAVLFSRRSDQLRKANFDLAEFHLFERDDLDSAEFYLRKPAEKSDSSEIWGRSIASLAYIAKTRGDTTARDSLFELILTKMPEGVFGNRARLVLDYPVEPEEIDSLSLMFDQAEIHWFVEDDPMRAREVYYKIAEQADSASDNRARALLAAAYLSRKILAEDSLAGELYAVIVDEFRGTPYADVSRDRASQRQEDDEKQAEDTPADSGMSVDKWREPHEEFMPDFLDRTPDLGSEETDLPDKIYDPNEVDELPQLLTSTSRLKNFIRSYMPEHEPDAEVVRGRVELQFVVTESGKIRNIEVLTADPPDLGYEEAAQRVLRRLRYRAGRYHGQEVSTRMKQVFVFEEDDDNE